MKISTEIDSIAKLTGKERAVELAAKAGFDAWDFSMFSMKDTETSAANPLLSAEYLAYARRLGQIGREEGICCNQSHAPFPSFDKKVRPYLERASAPQRREAASA